MISNAQRHYSGKKADTWSCGVLLYVLLFHKYPFERADDPAGADGFAKVRDTAGCWRPHSLRSSCLGLAAPALLAVSAGAPGLLN